jgi:hypothetical protein
MDVSESQEKGLVTLKRKKKGKYKKLLPLYSALSAKNAISFIHVFKGSFINGWKVLRQKLLFSTTSGEICAFYFA